MNKKTIAGLIGLVAAGAGITGSAMALGNLLYSRSVASAPCTPDKVDRWPSQQAGREWARSAVDFRTLTIPSSDGLKLWAAMVLSGAEELLRQAREYRASL